MAGRIQFSQRRLSLSHSMTGIAREDAHRYEAALGLIQNPASDRSRSRRLIAAIKPLAQQTQDALGVNTIRYRHSCRASSTMHTEEEPPSHQMRTSRERLQTWIALSFLSCQQRNDSKERTGTKPPSPGCQANEPRSRCWFRRERAFSPGRRLLDGRLWRESLSVERLSGTLLHLASTASSRD